MAIDGVAQPLRPVIDLLTDVNYAYGVTSASPLTVGREVIKGEVFNVMTTLVGDEIADPLYGSNLPLYVFAPFSPAIEQTILLDVYNALKRNVPQVGLDMQNSNAYLSPDGRIVGIQLALVLNEELFTVDIDFGIP